MILHDSFQMASFRSGFNALQAATAPRNIFLVISNQHLIRAGGIGSFVKGAVEMFTDLGRVPHLITDRPPFGPGKTMAQLVGANYTYGAPEKSTPAASRFAKVQVDLAKTRNFHRSLLQAQSLHGDPELVLVCTPEAMVGALAVCWAQTTKVMFYTHHENLFHGGQKRGFDKFDASYDAYLRGLLK